MKNSLPSLPPSLKFLYPSFSGTLSVLGSCVNQWFNMLRDGMNIFWIQLLLVGHFLNGVGSKNTIYWKCPVVIIMIWQRRRETHNFSQQSSSMLFRHIITSCILSAFPKKNKQIKKWGRKKTLPTKGFQSPAEIKTNIMCFLPQDILLCV